MRVLDRIDLILLGQRGHLLPWAPVFMAVGIATYFALRFEPGAAGHLAVLALGLVAAGLATWRPGGLAALGWAVALTAAGFALAGFRAHLLEGPVLGWRYYGPIEGRVVGIDRSASDALRLTLDRVVLERISPDRVPLRVRISLHGDGPVRFEPGARIMTTGHLSPPQGPVEPGGFDFRRHAWFQQIGAVGYTRNPVLMSAPPVGGQGVFGIRMALTAHVQAALPGDVGGFAAAVTTGDRSGIGQAALDDLRASNLAHLLAISGLHMGLLAGFVFAALRVGMALVPPLALRLPVRKIAAAGALAAAAVYLALSGGNVATERAFVMVAVALVAVMAERRAISLRSVAIAALLILAVQPESLLGPGFQMSFAATTALVAIFGHIRDTRFNLGPVWLRPVLGVALSSAVAGLATAPIGAAHFNTLAHYGLVANLVSVPLMGLLVIPAAVLAACLAPFGAEGLGFWAMGLGLRWILHVAETVAALDGAQSHIIAPGPAVLPVLALGLLWLMLWQGRMRLAGLAPAAVALWLWSGADRPAILIADTGGLVGVMTETGRALSKPRGAGFVAGNWLENDGDASDQGAAAARWSKAGGMDHAAPGLPRMIHVTGKKAAAALVDCTPDQVVVSTAALDPAGGCTVYDARTLRRTGSVAWTKGRWITARDVTGTRLWTPANQ